MVNPGGFIGERSYKPVTEPGALGSTRISSTISQGSSRTKQNPPQGAEKHFFSPPDLLIIKVLQLQRTMEIPQQ